MVEIVNLRRFRKRKARAEKDAAAAEHRVRFGRAKGPRSQAEAEAALSGRALDAHRVEPDGADPKAPA